MSDKEDAVNRCEVREHLVENPGARPSDVADRFGIHPSTADYHLRRLADEGAIVRERVGRQLHHYPLGEGWCEDSRAMHARLTPAGRALVRLALDRGVVSRRAVVGRGFSRSATRWALERMREAGLLERAGWGIYELAEGTLECAAAALREEACPRCNEVQRRAAPHGDRADPPRARPRRDAGSVAGRAPAARET